MSKSNQIQLSIAGNSPRLLDDRDYLLGTGTRADIQVPESNNTHAKLRKVAGRWFIESVQGSEIWIDNQQVSSCFLELGKVFRLTKTGRAIRIIEKQTQPLLPSEKISTGNSGSFNLKLWLGLVSCVIMLTTYLVINSFSRTDHPETPQQAETPQPDTPPLSPTSPTLPETPELPEDPRKYLVPVTMCSKQGEAWMAHRLVGTGIAYRDKRTILASAQLASEIMGLEIALEKERPKVPGEPPVKLFTFVSHGGEMLQIAKFELPKEFRDAIAQGGDFNSLPDELAILSLDKDGLTTFIPEAMLLTDKLKAGQSVSVYRLSINSLPSEKAAYPEYNQETLSFDRSDLQILGQKVIGPGIYYQLPTKDGESFEGPAEFRYVFSEDHKLIGIAGKNGLVAPYRIK